MTQLPALLLYLPHNVAVQSVHHLFWREVHIIVLLLRRWHRTPVSSNTRPASLQVKKIPWQHTSSIRWVSVACARFSAVSEHAGPAVWNSRLKSRLLALLEELRHLAPPAGCSLRACGSRFCSSLMPIPIDTSTGQSCEHRHVADVLVCII